MNLQITLNCDKCGMAPDGSTTVWNPVVGVSSRQLVIEVPANWVIIYDPLSGYNPPIKTFCPACRGEITETSVERTDELLKGAGLYARLDRGRRQARSTPKD